jgi:hypothetical protein
MSYECEMSRALILTCYRPPFWNNIMKKFTLIVAVVNIIAAGLEFNSGAIAGGMLYLIIALIMIDYYMTEKNT